MLRQRVITGIIAAPIALACVFLLPHLGFTLFVGAVLTIAAWEWANLAGLAGAYRFIYAGFVALALAGAFYLPVLPILLIAMFWWVMVLVLILNYPRFDELWGRPVVIILIGLVMLVPGFSALVEIKRFADSNYLICLLFFLIWGADIGAYFSGKAFGKSKLAPRVSPGKSWAGFYGGMCTSLVIATGMALYFGAPALLSISGAVFLLVCVGIAIVSVIGDLSVSMFKRHRDIKDTSNLLPGHGGFLDRIDSLLAASPAFALYLSLVDWL